MGLNGDMAPIVANRNGPAILYKFSKHSPWYLFRDDAHFQNFLAINSEIQPAAEILDPFFIIRVIAWEKGLPDVFNKCPICGTACRGIDWSEFVWSAEQQARYCPICQKTYSLKELLPFFNDAIKVVLDGECWLDPLSNEKNDVDSFIPEIRAFITYCKTEYGIEIQKLQLSKPGRKKRCSK